MIVYYFSTLLKYSKQCLFLIIADSSSKNVYIKKTRNKFFYSKKLEIRLVYDFFK